MLLQGLSCISHLRAKWCQCPKPCSWLWMTPIFARDHQHCQGIWSSERLLLSQWFYWFGVALNDRIYYSNSTMAFPVVKFCLLEETRLVFCVGHWRIQVLIRRYYEWMLYFHWLIVDLQFTNVHRLLTFALLWGGFLTFLCNNGNSISSQIIRILDNGISIKITNRTFLFQSFKFDLTLAIILYFTQY